MSENSDRPASSGGTEENKIEGLSDSAVVLEESKGFAGIGGGIAVLPDSGVAPEVVSDNMKPTQCSKAKGDNLANSSEIGQVECSGAPEEQESEAKADVTSPVRDKEAVHENENLPVSSSAQEDKEVIESSEGLRGSSK